MHTNGGILEYQLNPEGLHPDRCKISVPDRMPGP